MITIKKNMCDFYEVKVWGTSCVVLQEKFEHAIDLCRLRLGTTLQENNIHSYRVLHRTPPSAGHVAPNRKVKKDDIRTFYELNQQGMSADRIGIIYGVCGSTIRRHIRKYKALWHL